MRATKNKTVPAQVTEPVSWAPEVIADGSGKWCGNALRFATKAEAEANVFDLSMRWCLVRETRAVPSQDPVNYVYRNGVTSPVAKAGA